MKIEFEYLDTVEQCCHNSEWGACCCTCEHHLFVTKHCCHSPGEDRCVCNDKLGFYVCILWHDIEGARSASLSGKHGMCEEYTRRRHIPELHEPLRMRIARIDAEIAERKRNEAL